MTPEQKRSLEISEQLFAKYKEIKSLLEVEVFVNSKIAKLEEEAEALKAEKKDLQQQIDAEGMGHPLDQ